MIIDSRIRLPYAFREATEEAFEAFYGKYNQLLNVFENNQKNIDDLISEMDQAGVTYGVIHAEFEFAEQATRLNEQVAQLVAHSNGRFKGFGTLQLDRLHAIELVKQVEQIHALGLIGINCQPVFFNVNPLDRRLYPAYVRAAELGLIVSFHTGIHYSLQHTLEQSNPLYLDTLAVDIPDLKIIACHSGWPFMQEILAITRRHQSIYLDFGGISPKYIEKPNSGWDVVFETMDNLLQRQILFATDWPVMSPIDTVKRWETTQLKEETKQALLSNNAARLFGFEK